MSDKKDKNEKATKNTGEEAQRAESAKNSEVPEKRIKKEKGSGKVEAKIETKNATKDSASVNVSTPKKKVSKRRHVARAKAYILCSYNNTVITISDLDGNVLGWASSGALGFKGPKKATPFAATLVAQKVVEKTARFGIKEVNVFIKGVGGGREASVRALGNTGLLISSIKDITPVPHNGCRPKKPRRV